MTDALQPGLLTTIRDRLAAGKPVRRALPAGGRLHIDRKLPFLVVYRQPADRADPGTRRLVQSQAAYLVASGAEGFLEPLRELLVTVLETLSPELGAFLVIELWTAEPADATAGDPPLVRVVSPDQQAQLEAVEILTESLAALEVSGWQPRVRHVQAKAVAPPGVEPLLDPAVANRLDCFVVGVELEPMFRSPEGLVYPALVRELASQLAPALQRSTFAFASAKTTAAPRAYQGLGRRWMVRAVRRVDQALDRVCAEFDFLLAVTPVDTAAAWERFRSAGRREAPDFHYRPLTTDPELLLRDLYAVPLEEVEDPTLERIYREKVREVARQLTMLAERNTHRFLPGSLQLYGGVEPELRELALEILGDANEAEALQSEEGPAVIDAQAFARLAASEIEHYRGQHPGFDAELAIVDDVSGLMVSKGVLRIDRTLALTPRRARALIDHEIGVHVVTYMNGKSQQLQIFRSGLAGYEGFQEGLSVLAEYLSGGLTRRRLQLLAARVMAVEMVVGGAGFGEVFEALTDRYSLPDGAAFTVAMRVLRGGGLTKDAVYLRGLQQVLGHLRGGGDLEPLWVGKIALQHAPLVQELLYRGVLHEPYWRPRCFETADAKPRLDQIRQGRRIT